MSDALLERIATALEKIAGAASVVASPPASGKPATGAATNNKPATGAATNNKPATGKPPTGKPNAAGAAPKKPAAQVGKYTEDQVRGKIREVAKHEALGKQEAMDILDENGGGVQNVTNLKPEFYDAVYDACVAALNNSAPGEDAAETGSEFDPTA